MMLLKSWTGLNGIKMVGLLLVLGAVFMAASVGAQQKDYDLDHSMSVSYLQNNLKKNTPRLILGEAADRQLKRALRSDPMVKMFYETLKSDAEVWLDEPLLERTMVGRRMSTGDTRVRLSTLAMVYHLSGEKKFLNRLNKEILAVCAFPDWNPSHFLDVAGTALPLALAIDWAGNDLPPATVERALQTLIDKGIMPGFYGDYDWWVKFHHNWNQVCQAGMVAAAIVIAEKNPQLVAKTIGRALDNMGLALQTYGPDGLYPEGATYWGFGILHTAITASMFESAFGTDFGISGFPGFMESADFVPIVTAPSGEFYNFYDCGSNLTEDRRWEGNAWKAIFNRSTIAVNLMWFARQTGNAFYFDPTYFTDTGENHRRQYFDAAALVWLAMFEATKNEQPPAIWKGEGINPVAVFSGLLEKAERTFIMDSPRSVVIKDNFTLNDSTEMLTWQLITTADVKITEGGAILKQNGKYLRLENLSHPGVMVSVVSLCSAPLGLDVQVKGLKRLGINVPAWIFEQGKGEIKVRLSGA